MGKDAIRQAPSSIFENHKQYRRALDKTWNVSARAPVFCKITKRQIKGVSKKTYRTARLISSHAFNVAASGAAAVSASSGEAHCKQLRLSSEPENSRAPWLPQLSKGSKMMLTQFLCALSQEAAIKGHAAREGSGNTKRLSAKHMRIGWGAVYDAVFASSSAMPRSVFVTSVERKKAKGNKNDKYGKRVVVNDQDDEDDAYAPPEDDASGNGD